MSAPSPLPARKSGPSSQRGSLLRVFLRTWSGLCLLGTVAGAAYLGLARVPHLELAASDPLLQGTPARYLEPPYAGAWIVTGDPAPRLATAFSQLDSSAWWWNFLFTAYGPVRQVSIDALSAPLPPELQILVVPGRAAAALATGRERVTRLSQFVEAGGLLMLENPPETLSSLAGSEERPIDVAERHEIDATSGTTFSDTHQQYLQLNLDSFDWKGLHGGEASTPRFGPFRRLALAPRGPSAGSQLLAEVLSPDGSRRPALWTQRLGSGTVVTLAFDFSRFLLTQLQGHPTEDFTFAPSFRTGALQNVPVPADLAAENPAFVRPELDLLQRALWDALQERHPLAALWPTPHGAPGAYLTTHDEEGFGDRSRYMSQEEQRQGVRATYFVLPDPITRKGLEALLSDGAEVALHWHRGFQGGHTRPVRYIPLLEQAMRLDEQRDRLEARLATRSPYRLPPFTRIHGLQWDPDFDSTFRKLAGAGLRLDSSYGPYSSLPPFLFGGTLPFRPLDRDGRLLPLFELPFVLQDDEAAPRERLRTLLQSASAHGSPIVPIFHVNTMAYKPSVEVLESWLEGFTLARQQHLWQGTIGDYLAFLEARGQVRLEQRWNRGEGRGRVDVEGAAQSLSLRTRTHAGRLEHLQVEGAPEPLRCLEVAGAVVALLPLPPGSHRWTARYGEGSPICPE